MKMDSSLIEYCLLNDKIGSKCLVQRPCVRKTFRLSSHTQEQFNIMPRTIKVLLIKLNYKLSYNLKLNQQLIKINF